MPRPPLGTPAVARPLVYVVEVPTPYRNAELDRAAAALPTGGFHALFLRPAADGCFEYRLPEVCPYRVLNGTPSQQGLPLGEVPRWLSERNPALVIVGGYAQPGARAALDWCRASGTWFALRSDSNVWTDRQKGWLKYFVRRARLGPWVRRAYSLLVTGRFNREFWQRYGMREAQEGWWPQWIDYEHFCTARTMAPRRDSLRARWGVETELAVLHVGRLIPRKRVDVLCEALLASTSPLTLLVAGHGPQESLLRSRYLPQLGSRLRLLGDVPPAELPSLYAAADVLALASGASEPWGMVVNESLAAGLPLLCHHHVGAAADLLEPGRSGWAVGGDSARDWAVAFDRLAIERDRLATFSQGAMEIIDAWREASEPGACLRRLIESLPPAHR